MKLKNLFFLLAILLIFAWGILFFFTLKEKGTLHYVGEAVITLSLIVLVYFYRKVVKPLDSIYCSGLFLPQSGKTSGQYSQRNGFASRTGFQQPSRSCKTG